MAQIPFGSADGYYRPHADQPASVCSSCDEIWGGSCKANATLSTITIQQSYWRHSSTTLTTYLCKSSGDWSPCRGGTDAGIDGNGYCEPGYVGPRCEVCSTTNESVRHFDQQDARCNDCGTMSTGSLVALLLCTLLPFAAICIASAPSRGSHHRLHRLCPWFAPTARFFVRILKSLGWRAKLKVALASSNPNPWTMLLGAHVHPARL